MTEARSLKSKVVLNFSGTVLPMLIGLVTIPSLIGGMGVERFGLLSIAWMLVGYFGLLDMGLGRALTQKVAQRIGSGNTDNLKPLIWKALGAVALLGVIGCITLATTAQWLVLDVFKISNQYQEETINGIFWLSLTIPFAIVSTGLLGVLEGQQNFGWTAIVRAPLGVLMFIAPIITMQWTASLEWILASLFVVRVAAWAGLMIITHHTLKPYQGWLTNKEELKSLFKFGGWVTVSNIISPMMVYFDRFYIAAVLSAAVVAFYTTPFDLLTKALVVPFALIGVIFTSFATHWETDKIRVRSDLRKAMIAVIAIMLPFSLISGALAKEGMTLWLGEEFANESYRIIQWLSVGIFINAIAMVPFALIQATGRADITAKMHLAELPVYGILLWYLTMEYGLQGAAMAWTARVLIDLILMSFYMHHNRLI